MLMELRVHTREDSAASGAFLRFADKTPAAPAALVLSILTAAYKIVGNYSPTAH